MITYLFSLLFSTILNSFNATHVSENMQFIYGVNCVCCRLEFDASRADYERAQAAFRAGTAGAQMTLEKAEQKMTIRRGRMDKLSQALVAKIKLLEDNKVYYVLHSTVVIYMKINAKLRQF
jgi:hypothetical protein